MKYNLILRIYPRVEDKYHPAIGIFKTKEGWFFTDMLTLQGEPEASNPEELCMLQYLKQALRDVSNLMDNDEYFMEIPS